MTAERRIQLIAYACTTTGEIFTHDNNQPFCVKLDLGAATSDSSLAKKGAKALLAALNLPIGRRTSTDTLGHSRTHARITTDRGTALVMVFAFKEGRRPTSWRTLNVQPLHEKNKETPGEADRILAPAIAMISNIAAETAQEKARQERRRPTGNPTATDANRAAILQPTNLPLASTDPEPNNQEPIKADPTMVKGYQPKPKPERRRPDVASLRVTDAKQERPDLARFAPKPKNTPRRVGQIIRAEKHGEPLSKAKPRNKRLPVLAMTEHGEFIAFPALLEVPRYPRSAAIMRGVDAIKKDGLPVAPNLDPRLVQLGPKLTVLVPVQDAGQGIKIDASGVAQHFGLTTAELFAKLRLSREPTVTTLAPLDSISEPPIDRTINYEDVIGFLASGECPKNLAPILNNGQNRAALFAFLANPNTILPDDMADAARLITDWKQRQTPADMERDGLDEQ